MKRNSKQTKGWGFKFLAILSSIMMVINTVTPVIPVFAETPNEVIPAEDTTPEEEATPAEEPAEDVVTADEDAPVVNNDKSGEEADEKADSKENPENTDEENQVSGTDTSDGSDEKENNNTDQSLQNGENSETVETPKADADKPAENVNLEYVVNAKSTKGISLTTVDTDVAKIGDTGYETLAKAIEAANGTAENPTEIIILKDVGEVSINNGKNVKLNLEGRTVTGILRLYEGNLTITNGTFSRPVTYDTNGKPNNNCAVYVYPTNDSNKGAGTYNNLVIDSTATISGYNAVALFDYPSDNTKGYGSHIEINGNLRGVNSAFFVLGNKKAGNSVIDINGLLNGERAGLAQNGESIVNIHDGAKIIAGEEAIEQRAGTLNIKGGEFESTSTTYECVGNGDGTTTKGAALAIAQHTTMLQLTTNISGGVFSGLYGLSVCNPQNNSAPTPIISIEGGNFVGINSGIILNDAGYTSQVEKFISGGTFSSPVAEEYCADGYMPKDMGNGKYGVEEIEYVAQIGDNKYETLTGAILAVSTGGVLTEIILLKDVSIDGDGTLAFNGGRKILLNLSGHTISNSGFVYVYNGDLEVKNGKIITSSQINLYGYENDSFQSHLKIDEDVVIESLTDRGITIFGGSDSSKSYGAVLDMEGTLNKNIFVSGNIKEGNTTVNFSGTITSPGVGIAQNGYSIVNIYTGAKIIAVDAAIEQRAGILNVYGGEFESTSDAYVCNPNGNGTTSAGVGLAVAQHTTTLNIATNIYGGAFSGIYGIGICNPQNNGAPTPVISIKGGTFNGSTSGMILDAAGYTKPIEKFVSGGTFSSPVEEAYCVDGYIPKDNGNNTYGVTPGYKVTFMNEGVEYTGLYIKTNAKINENLIEDPIKTGYTFTGWYKTGLAEKWDFDNDTVTGAETLYSNFEADTYTVTFNPGTSGYVSTPNKSVTYDDYYGELPVPTLTGYVFSGWYNGSELIESGNIVNITGAETFIAQWKVGSGDYVVYHIGEDLTGDYVENLGTENLSGTTEETATAGEKSFEGYTYSGSHANNVTSGEIVGDGSLKLRLYYARNIHNVIYEYTGNVPASQTAPITSGYKYGATVTVETAPSLSGYSFAWSTGDASFTMPNNDVVITGTWTANTDTPYKVEHYQQNTGDNNYTLVTTDNLSGTTDQSTAAVTKDYTGFTLSGDITEYQTAIAGDESTVVKLYYNRNPHTLKFVVDGVETTGTVVYGADITAPADPTKDSCNTFAGWTSSVDGLTTTGTMPDSDVTFTANWNYTCTRSSGGGGGGGSSRNNTNNMQEVVLGGEVEVNTGDEAEINTGDENKLDENNDEGKGSIGDTQGYDPELVEAYKWAYAKGITTMPTIEQARLKDGITRAELAKMMVVFMSEVLHRQPVITETFDYPDVNEKALGDLTGYIQLAYQYQIMGIQADGKPLKKFNPRGKVSRAEFATVLSRVLYGSVNNQKGANYREKHIEALNKAGILTNTDPKIQELRGWIILMLYRSQNSETNNVEENTAQVTTGDVAEVESGSAVEVATGTTAEIATGEVAQITTGNVAEVESGSTAEVTTGTTAEIDTGAVVEANTGSVAQTAIAEANTGDVAKVESGSTAEVATGDSK